ncbi:uncharacterized protein LOC110619061 [Manihot esculenta]|uniref:mTERF protein n=1 Tax=Manihot esculenta TaxID=3983 RepID=A0A2C9VKG6_MANES|nr:uncharacterized protein LOC110619061 [Manihot esculenta]OAY46054.1 hypothetical protein MANES_07G112800v8 [Manihot esculenta]
MAYYSVLDLLKYVDHEQEQYPYTVPYLVNSCGFSLESAKCISEKVNFESADKPDAVVSLLRDYGFTNVHISRLIRKAPLLLLSNPAGTLLPKLEFQRSIGVSGSEIGKIASRNTSFLRQSLKKHIIPCYNILKSVVISDVKAVKALRLLSDTACSFLPENLPVNLSTISHLLMKQPSLACLKSAKFRQIVNKAIEMGFDPLKSTFAHALYVLSCPNIWEKKIEVYRNYGLSEDEIWSAIRKFPLCMSFSRKKITNTMDFLVNKVGWLPADFARVPFVLCYSSQKRIIPRCYSFL